MNRKVYLLDDVVIIGPSIQWATRHFRRAIGRSPARWQRLRLDVSGIYKPDTWQQWEPKRLARKKAA